MVKIHILGGAGSGKTTLANHISSLIHAHHYDLDKIGLENGKVTDEDAFAIVEEPEWVSEGFYLIWTEPLLYHADYIVVLEAPWPVVVWRIISRHVKKSISGTNPYPGINGIKLLFKLLKDNRRYYLNKTISDTSIIKCIEDYFEEQPGRATLPTPESVHKDVEKYFPLSFPPNAEFVRRYLEKYEGKVFLVKTKADRERLLKILRKQR